MLGPVLATLLDLAWSSQWPQEAWHLFYVFNMQWHWRAIHTAPTGKLRSECVCCGFRTGPLNLCTPSLSSHSQTASKPWDSFQNTITASISWSWDEKSPLNGFALPALIALLGPSAQACCSASHCHCGRFPDITCPHRWPHPRRHRLWSARWYCWVR